MECNKDEAVRAKEIAERKFMDRNYSSAKKFVLKAQNLYPGLDGLHQMMTTLEVFISAEDKINGEMDWYGILGVNPLADDETIRKQYRKLALVLHPDKNKSLGAEGAFKLVSEAWTLLSDKTKRLAYNQKRDVKNFCQQKFPTHTRNTSAPSSANGFQNFNNVASGARKNVQSNVRAGPSPFHSSSRKPETFWTLCNRCKTHYEYLRVYLNHTLLCPNCHEPFLAIEKSPPQNVFKSPSWSSQQQQHQNQRQHPVSNNLYGTGRNAKNPETGSSGGLNSVDKTKPQWGPSSRTGGFGNTVSSASFPGQTERAKRERDETRPVTEGEWSHLCFMNKKRTTDDRFNNYGVHMANQMARGDGYAGVGGLPEFRQGIPETQKFYGFYGAFNKANSHRELSIFEIRDMLQHKGRTEIRKKLKEWSLQTDRSGTKKQAKNKKSSANDGSDDIEINGKYSAEGKGRQDRKPQSSSLSDDTSSENEPITINVPDPDFHNFDLDRAESSFGEDQVWACYDDDDGMPRFYARIHKVISVKPFKMRISWLNSRSNTEIGPMDWIGSGFSKTCGEYRIGRHEVAGSLNSFSHKVCWVKGLRGALRIFPHKGEVWALYRNWSADWNKDTPEEIIHKYDMVEVLDDFNEEQGVSVAPLIKVSGFRTVFRTNMDPREVRKIPKEEMFRFSHQVPTYLLTGQEGQNAPRGCRELDPAATPLELLQIVTEANQRTTEEKEENSEEGVSRSTQETVVNDVENTLKAKKVDLVTKKDERTKVSSDVAVQGS